MTRTNIEIDDDLVALVMQQNRLSTKREAVDFALRQVAVVPLRVEEAKAMRGVGWDGDLEQMRTARTWLHDS